MSENILQTVEQQIEELEKHLETEIPKVEPYPGGAERHLFIAYKAVLLRRIYEPSESSYSSFLKGHIVSGSILARSACETVAVLYYGYKKINNSVELNSPGGVGLFLHRALWGTKLKGEEELPKAIQVLTAIDHLNKAYKGTRKDYDFLCEIAHPNFAGTGLLYFSHDFETNESKVDHNPDKNSPEALGLGSLNILLDITFEIISLLNAVEPKFYQSVDEFVDKHNLKTPDKANSDDAKNNHAAD
jgi:hypothetical protein